MVEWYLKTARQKKADKSKSKENNKAISHSVKITLICRLNKRLSKYKENIYIIKILKEVLRTQGWGLVVVKEQYLYCSWSFEKAFNISQLNIMLYVICYKYVTNITGF